MYLKKISEKIRLKITEPFTEDEFLSIEIFKEKALKLEEVPPKTFKYSLVGNYGCISVKTENIINDQEFESQLMRFRPFYLKKELCHFDRVCNLVKRKFRDENFNSYIDKLKYEWKNATSQDYYKIIINKNNVVINSEKIFDYYFNTEYMHTDILLREEFKQIQEIITKDYTKALFYYAVQQRMCQVLNLYSLILYLEKDSQEIVFNNFTIESELING
jgi:hypothetical protein